MTAPCALEMLKRYALARAGSFTRAGFLAWAAHHGLARGTPGETIDDAFTSALDMRLIERVPGPEAEVHPLFRAVA